MTYPWNFIIKYSESKHDFYKNNEFVESLDPDQGTHYYIIG